MNRRTFLAPMLASAAALGLWRWIRPAAAASAVTAATLPGGAAAGDDAAGPTATGPGPVSPGNADPSPAPDPVASSRSAPQPRPAHHDADGRFSNPWPTANTRESGGVLRWQRERRQQELAPTPPASAFPRAAPQITQPRAGADDLRITWVGHATFLLQVGGMNILTDPHWSRRAAPVQFAGPARLTAPGVEWDALPPIDAVLLSHDHYDHLDDGTIRRLHRRFGDAVQWFTPLGYRAWFRARGVRTVTELDWWEDATLDGPAGPLRFVALPCQHWTRRTLWDEREKLWASWGVFTPTGRSVYFGGDSGYFPGYPEINERMGTFDALLLPIGAYEPRWFMRPVHMNPEEAARTYLDLGGSGTAIGMHWGTFRLTDEDPLEPPIRMRQAWAELGLPTADLRILPHGGTWRAGGDPQ
jgi:N-acyl-phosphatidylethanolamine-hydrolysing phospholipase D